MRQIVARGSLVLGGLVVLLVFSTSPAGAYPPYSASFELQNSNCWEEGQIGSPSQRCQNAGEAEFLRDRVLDDTNGVEDYRVAEPGQYCSYFGITDTLPDYLTDPYFGAPYGNAVGDAYGNVCAAWNSGSEPTFWGVQTRNGPESGDSRPCAAPGPPEERCGMQHYTAFAGAESVNHPSTLPELPWASYYGSNTRPYLEVYSSSELRSVTTGPKRGNSWGYVCPALEDRTTGNILEVCYEEWMSPVGAPYEWRYRHIVECKAASGEFGHNVDKVMLPANGKQLVGFFGEPVEKFPLEGEPDEEDATVDENLGASELEYLVQLDDSAFVAKTSEGGRDDEPELEHGCGRDSSTNPEEWAVIGISNGIEAWKSEQVAVRLNGTILDTTFEPHEIEATEPRAKEITETEATVEDSIDPYGFETEYVVEYANEPMGSGRYASTPEQSAGSKLVALPVSARLTGLASHKTYYYRIRAFHPRPGIGNEVIGEQHTFRTGPPAVRGEGSTLQELAQQKLFIPKFNEKGEGKVTEYRGVGSGPGLEAWGNNARDAGEFYSWQYIGTDQPPNPTQKAAIESAAGGAKLLTIPTSQAAVAIILHLPSGCTGVASSAKKQTGRLALDDATLEGIFRHTITKWSELTEEGDELLPSGCAGTSPITRVVRKEGAGTTAILKKWLYQLNIADIDGSKTWDTLAEELKNINWPAETENLVRGAGDQGVVSAVSATAGSIGYVNLANAYQGGFSKEGGIDSWAVIQNQAGKKFTYADPETPGKKVTVEGRKEATEGASNCAANQYVNGVATKFPPKSTEEAWNEVSTIPSEPGYPICGLSYDLSLRGFSLIPTLEHPTEPEVNLLRKYFTFMIDQGSSILKEGTDYASLPENAEEQKSVYLIAKKGAEQISE